MHSYYVLTQVVLACCVILINEHLCVGSDQGAGVGVRDAVDSIPGVDAQHSGATAGARHQ